MTSHFDVQNVLVRRQHLTTPTHALLLLCRCRTHHVVVLVLVSLRFALVRPDHVRQLVLAQELGGDVRPEETATAAKRVRVASGRGSRVTPEDVEQLEGGAPQG